MGLGDDTHNPYARSYEKPCRAGDQRARNVPWGAHESQLTHLLLR